MTCDVEVIRQTLLQIAAAVLTWYPDSIREDDVISVQALVVAEALCQRCEAQQGSSHDQGSARGEASRKCA